MVASAIDKGNCESSPNHDVTTAMPFGTNFPTATTMDITVSISVNSTTGENGNDMSQEELMCRVGMATAVTFLAGIFQVLVPVSQCFQTDHSQEYK